MATEFTVARHPDWKLTGSVFKWAVFKDGELFEGFIRREAAELAAEEYREEFASAADVMELVRESLKGAR